MNIKNTILHEFQEEAAITKKFIDVFEDRIIDFKPHEKSMSTKQLMNHIVEILGWPEFILETEKLDFEAGDYMPNEFSTKAEIEDKFNEFTEKTEKALNATTDEILEHQRWKMTMGDHIIADYSKYGAIRHALNQLTHHRAQLGVYYRLNDIPVPGSYGPSADDQNF